MNKYLEAEQLIKCMLTFLRNCGNNEIQSKQKEGINNRLQSMKWKSEKKTEKIDEIKSWSLKEKFK